MLFCFLFSFYPGLQSQRLLLLSHQEQKWQETRLMNVSIIAPHHVSSGFQQFIQPYCFKKTFIHIHISAFVFLHTVLVHLDTSLCVLPHKHAHSVKIHMFVYVLVHKINIISAFSLEYFIFVQFPFHIRETEPKQKGNKERKTQMLDQVLAADRYIWHLTFSILTLTFSIFHQTNLGYNTMSHSRALCSSSCSLSLSIIYLFFLLLSMSSFTCSPPPPSLSFSFPLFSPSPLYSWTLRICADSPWCQFFSLAKRGPLTSDSNFSLMVGKTIRVCVGKEIK